MGSAEHPLRPIDAFDLPEWLGVGEVLWTPEVGQTRGFHSRGALSCGESALACDLLAVDEASPAPITDNPSRTLVHQTWRHSQVLIADYAGRMVIAVPGTRITPELALEALARFAKAVGANPTNYAAMLRIVDSSSR